MNDETETAPEVIVRGVTVQDIPALHRLCGELGYDPAQTGFGDRVVQVVERDGHAVFVAADTDDRAIGFIHVFVRHSIEIAPCAQVQALVVGEAARRLGAGALLMGAAEQWARTMDLSWMSLYCTSTRDAAHHFYSDQGFDGTLSATRFNKQLT